MTAKVEFLSETKAGSIPFCRQSYDPDGPKLSETSKTSIKPMQVDFPSLEVRSKPVFTPASLGLVLNLTVKLVALASTS